MKISVTDFLAPIGDSVFNFRVHLQVGLVYCVNENKDTKAHVAFFFIFSFCLFFIIHMGHFSSVFSATICFRIMKFYVYLQVGRVYCVNKK